MKFYAYHGVMPQEKKVGNWFEVSLSVALDLTAAAQSDNLNDTLNYALLYQMVQEEMAIPSKLLEHVAGRLLQTVRQAFPHVKGCQVEIAKLTPPFKCNLKSVSVKLQEGELD